MLHNFCIIKGLRPYALNFIIEIKIVSYSFSSPVIEYNSNGKLLKVWSGVRFYKNQHDMKKTWHSTGADSRKGVPGVRPP